MRALRRGVLGLCLLSLAASAGALTLWTISVFASDRYDWSQRLSFLPRQYLVGPAAAAWGLFALGTTAYGWLRPRAEGLPWKSERRGRSRVVRLLGRARLLAGLWVFLAAVHLVGAEWRWPLNAGLRPPPLGHRFRVIHWNVGWSHPDEVLGALAERSPDLAIVVNPMTRADLSWDLAGLGQRLGGQGRIIRDWPINVVSRWPIRRWGVTELGFTSPVSVESEGGEGTRPTDPGHATFVELEVGPPLERPVVVWIIDLPSDPTLHRPEVMRQARERIEAWLGPHGEAFPEPDVMIGDFNTPRGSWSLHGLRRRPGYHMADAHDQGGLGPDATYPVRGWMLPITLGIDQCFVAPALRAAFYDAQDGGDTRHLMQVVDLVAE